MIDICMLLQDSYFDLNVGFMSLALNAAQPLNCHSLLLTSFVESQSVIIYGTNLFKVCTTFNFIIFGFDVWVTFGLFDFVYKHFFRFFEIKAHILNPTSKLLIYKKIDAVD